MGRRDVTHQRIISGARVAFDPRMTAEAHVSRDEENYKSKERPMRRNAWEARMAEKRRGQKGAAE
jgi:hypothetical protein